MPSFWLKMSDASGTSSVCFSTRSVVICVASSSNRRPIESITTATASLL